MSYCGSSCGYGSSSGMSATAYGQQAVSYSSNGSYGGAGHAPDQNLYAHSNMSQLEAIANRAESIAKPSRAFAQYVPSSAAGAYLSLKTPGEYFIADSFLKPGSTARFVGDASEIQAYIEEAFRATTGEEMPKDIIVNVLDSKEFKKAHSQHDGAWSEGILGFSINTNGRGASLVFAKADQLDRLMLTIGHEIGHVLSSTLKNRHDEEAKAFAFSLAWMDAVRGNNIAGIGKNILPEPANNGLHDIAFSFVQTIMKYGSSAWETFKQLASGAVTITEQPIIMEE